MVIVSAPKVLKWAKPGHETTRVCKSKELLGKGKDRCLKPIREMFISSGCSALSGSVFKNDCSPSLMPLSNESDEDDAKVLSEGHAIRVKWR